MTKQMEKMMNKQLILSQAESLFKESKYNISLLSNATAFLNEILTDINWVGFYLLEDGKLILGPFQGKVACEIIALNSGVCGYTFTKGETVVVDDVYEFEGHIVCDEKSRSEVVIPLIKDGIKFGVLDIDAPVLNRFNKEVVEVLEEVVKIIIKYYKL